jgi:hypothetical protein
MEIRRLWPEGRPDASRARGVRRLAPATVVSLVFHVVLAIVVWNAIQFPMLMDRMFTWDRAPLPRESVRFVSPGVPPPSTSRPTGTAGPTRAPAAPEPEAPPLVAPREVPTTLPPIPTETRPARPDFPGPKTGPIAGGIGPTRGAQPTFDDPRIWVPDPPLVYAPKTPEQRLDSAVVATFRRHIDSVAAATYTPNKFERGDWTMEKDGQKWGIDPNFIRLGKVSIPTALLALLPFNRGQGNPIAIERERSMAAMRADIVYHAQATLNEEEFRKAVRAIRDRKEREKRLQEQRGRIIAPPSPPAVSPGERPPNR